MKGAEAYVNDQWQSSGLANLPQDSDALTVTLKFIVPRAAQTTGLLNHIAEVAERRLEEAYPGRNVRHKPVVGSVVGDGTGDGVELEFQVAAVR